MARTAGLGTRRCGIGAWEAQFCVVRVSDLLSGPFQSERNWGVQARS